MGGAAAEGDGVRALPFEMTAERYDFGPLSRGTRIGQPTGYRYGDETDQRMQDVPTVPDVFVDDLGDVEVGERRMPTEVFLAWAKAVIAEIEDVK